MKKRELERHLIAHGCALARQAANHELWENAASGERAAVPRHREIKTTTAARRNRCRGAGQDALSAPAPSTLSWCQHHASLERDERRNDGSAFAFGAMRSAAALLDVLDGAPVRDREPPELVETLHRTARLQCVKCVPRRPGSKPTTPMWHNCPPLLQGAELDIVKPARLLALGIDPRWAIERLDGYRPARTNSSLTVRGRLDRRGWSAEVYFIAHPRAGTSNASHDALLRSLRRRRPA